MSDIMILSLIGPIESAKCLVRLLCDCKIPQTASHKAKVLRHFLVAACSGSSQSLELFRLGTSVVWHQQMKLSSVILKDIHCAKMPPRSDDMRFMHHSEWLNAGLFMQAPNFNALTIVSLVAAVMSLSYSTIAFGMSVHSGKHQRNAPYDLAGSKYSKLDGIFGVFNALGTVAFAYGMPPAVTLPS